MELRPDILVVVDFTVLNISADSMANRGTNSVQVMLGLTRDTNKVVRNTIPTTLIPGVNLVGIADVFRIRQTYVKPEVSAFGLFQVSGLCIVGKRSLSSESQTFNTFLTTQVVHVWPEPAVSTFIPRANNIASIRIIQPYDFSDWDVTRDARTKSFLAGFASLGGIWTLSDMFFRLLFGSFLTQILFGRPYA
jgi:hypothetical protein